MTLHSVVQHIPSAPMQTDAVRIAAQTDGVVKIEGADTGLDAFAAFMETLGPAMFTTGETLVPRHPMLNVVTNMGRATKPKSVFHSDTTYVARPPSFSGLYAVDVPEAGGETLFTDQYCAYETLPAILKELLYGATVAHEVTGVELPSGEERQARHPVVRKHPDTGRLALYLTTPARLSELRLADGTDRSDVIKRLYDHSIEFRKPLRHIWAKGDVIVWDNRRTLHSADHSQVVGNRTLYRALVKGERPE